MHFWVWTYRWVARTGVCETNYYGCGFVLDWPRRAATCMPLAKATLKGFTKSSPEHSREPPAYETWWLVIGWFLRPPVSLNRVMAACWAAISMDCYLRPSEGLELLGKHVHRPRRGAAAQGWSFTIAPVGGRPAKNQTFDAGVVVGLADRK